MLFFLQQDGIKKLIPEVKEKLSENEARLNSYIDLLYRNILDFLPRLASAIIVLLVGMWLINRIARLSAKAMSRRDIDVSLRTFLKSLISIGLKIILIVTVAGMMGIGTASFVTILGAAGLAVGLALQGSLSNFAGGVLILIFKPFRVGDSIEAQGQTGEVKEIQIFNTILLTGENRTVIIPNGPLSNGTIVNNTRHGSLRLDMSFTVSSKNDMELVRSTIMSVLLSNEQVLQMPPPQIHISSIAGNAVTFQVMPYCATNVTAALRTELYLQIMQALGQSHIVGALPETIVHQVLPQS